MAKAKPPIQRDQWLWVLTKATRISDEPNHLGVHVVTVQLPNGNLETMPFNPDKMRTDEDISRNLHP
jgi:hypothetical protein